MAVKPAYDNLLKKATWKAHKGTMATLLGPSGVGAALEACETAWQALGADELAPKKDSFKGTADVQKSALGVQTKVQGVRKLALAAQTSATAASTKLKSIPLGGKEASTMAANVATRAAALAEKLTMLEAEVKRAYDSVEDEWEKDAAVAKKKAVAKERLKAVVALYVPANTAVEAVLKAGDDDFAGAYKALAKAVPLVKALAVKVGEYKDDATAALLVKAIVRSLELKTQEEYEKNAAKLKPAIVVKNKARDLNVAIDQINALFAAAAK